MRKKNPQSHRFIRMEITGFQVQDREVWRPPLQFALVATDPNCTISIYYSFFSLKFEAPRKERSKKNKCMLVARMPDSN